MEGNNFSSIDREQKNTFMNIIILHKLCPHLTNQVNKPIAINIC